MSETGSLPNLAARNGIVIFDRSKATATSLFEAKNLLELPARQIAARAMLASPARLPEFLTSRDFFRTSWWSRLGAILSRYPKNLTLVGATYFKDLPVRPRKFALGRLSVSAVLHAAAFLLLPFVLKYFPFEISRAVSVPAPDQQVLYYHLADPEHHIRAPRIQPPGPGATPGAGSVPQLPPLQGASVSREMLFAVSHPKFPDNNRQTIIQPLQAPDLRIKADLKLPNLMLRNPQAPKAHLQFNPNNVKPLQQANRELATVAPTLTQTTAQPLTDALSATSSNPRLAVPVGASPAPNLPSRANGTAADVGAPELEGNGAPAQGLLILGTDPGSSSQMVALPPGNRYGEFSIAPGGNGSGAPGGQPAGSANGGFAAGSSSGTDAVGSGAGTSGGGGKNSGSTGFVSIKGSGDGTGESLGSLAPERVASMVFALPKFAGPRHSTLLVAAGPMGGGGLSVYGALRCGKIYTVFLPATGKGWTLQYCQTLAPGQAPPVARVTTSVVHMEEPIVPPEADARFDFKRTPLPFEKLHKYVILKGRIDEEGKVADLAVYQGLSPEMDAAARQAFSQWTFRPATRSGKPISVDILVGIPSDPPKTTSTQATPASKEAKLPSGPN